MADYKMAAIKCCIEHVVHNIIVTFSEFTKSKIKYFKIESKMAAVKKTRKYAFVQLWLR